MNLSWLQNDSWFPCADQNLASYSAVSAACAGPVSHVVTSGTWPVPSAHSVLDTAMLHATSLYSLVCVGDGTWVLKVTSFSRLTVCKSQPEWTLQLVSDHLLHCSPPWTEKCTHHLQQWHILWGVLFLGEEASSNNLHLIIPSVNSDHPCLKQEHQNE